MGFMMDKFNKSVLFQCFYYSFLLIFCMECSIFATSSNSLVTINPQNLVPFPKPLCNVDLWIYVEEIKTKRKD